MKLSSLGRVVPVTLALLGAACGPQEEQVALDEAMPGAVETPVDSAGWVPFGLADRKVSAVEVFGEHLYAATDAGLWRRPLVSGAWSLLGLSSLDVSSLAFRPGVTPVLYASLRNEPRGRQVAFASGPDFGTWTLTQTAFAGSGRSVAPKLNDPSVVFATTNAGFYRSSDGGRSFTRLIANSLLNATAATPADSERVWSGGETMIFAPVLYRSLDGGRTFTTIDLWAGGDNAVDSILTSPTDKNLVVLGMEGRVMRTADAGKTWTTPLQGSSAYLFGFARDPRDARHLLVGGGTFEGVIELYESRNEGLSFNPLAPVVIGIPANADLCFATVAGKSRAFLGSGRGVFFRDW